MIDQEGRLPRNRNVLTSQTNDALSGVDLLHYSQDMQLGTKFTF
jgi:hypothetical protein